MMESLSYKVVEVYYNFKNKEKMMIVLEWLLYLKDRIDFLVWKYYIEEVVYLFLKVGIFWKLI